jgi:hypothetical protein
MDWTTVIQSTLLAWRNAIGHGASRAQCHPEADAPLSPAQGAYRVKT